MKLDKGEYEVVALDGTGCNLASSCVATVGEAKRLARRLLAEDELLNADMVKTEVRNHRGECVRDFFVPKTECGR